MKPTRLTLRLTVSLMALDLLATCEYVWLASQSPQLANGASIPIATILLLARLLIVYQQLSRWVGPTERILAPHIAEHAASRTQHSVDALLVADNLLQLAPLRLALLVSGLWTGSALAMAAYSASGLDFLEGLRLSVGNILCAAGLGLGLGALAYPGTEWLLVDPANATSRLARARKVVLQRPERWLVKRMLSIFVCVTTSSGLVIASATAITSSAQYNRADATLLSLTTLSVLLILDACWAGASAAVVARGILKELVSASAATRRLAERGDLSQMELLPSAYCDELGGLIESVNEVIGTMSSMADAATRIAAGTLGTEILGNGELPTALRGVSSRVSSVVVETRETSAELASAATEISAAAQELEVASASQASGMIEIAQTMDSLSKSAAHVSDAVQGVAQNAERTLHNTEQMVSRIDSLSMHANRIGDILEVIREIANQSDLLALNGSLEATRVGEAGRGFALVAGEMRRLAERVTASVQDVKKLVADIRESGASTVVATEESKKLAEATAGAARSITLVTQQQRSSTEQVNQSVRALSEIVEQAALATTQTRASAEGLKVFADRLAHLVIGFELAK